MPLFQSSTLYLLNRFRYCLFCHIFLYCLSLACQWPVLLQTRRLLKIHQERTSMLLSSTSRIFWAHQLHFSSILYMTHTVMVPILFVGTPSAFARVSQLLFPMGFGSTFQTTMPLPSLSSPLRGIRGKAVKVVHSNSFHHLGILFC